MRRGFCKLTQPVTCVLSCCLIESYIAEEERQIDEF